MSADVSRSRLESLRGKIRGLSDEQAARGFAMLGGAAAIRSTLVAYITPASGRTLDPADVRRQLVDVLPRTSIPSRITVLEQIPRTANGKEDRVKLEQLCRVRSKRSEVPSGDPLETLVSTIWRRELGLPDEADAGDFFGSGGTSLSAIRTLAVLSAELATDIPLVAVFRHSRADLLAAYLREQIVDEKEVVARAESALRRLDAAGN